MLYLLVASLVWAFSFGLIKHKLVQVGMDPYLVALIRLGLSFLLFLPFVRIRRLGKRVAAVLIVVGAVQYGLMYVTYLRSYLTLPAHMVAIFTIFTPLYVTLLHDVSVRQFHVRFLGAAVLAVAGAALIVYSGRDFEGTLSGFLLVQASNVCFAAGQIAYRRLMGVREHRGRAALSGEADGRTSDHEVFGLLYLGGVAVAGVVALFHTDWSAVEVSAGQWGTLLYLGLVPSGVCFFLWNTGARRTNAGTLAVLNNAKIPLAVLVSLWCFGERIQGGLVKFVVGAVLILVAIVLNETRWAKTEAHE